ncbi:MAG: DUF433 domain-containing protein [Nitrospira sp. NTP2]|nr:DUF433 domain-containing protein [Nitrospira sp. NTP2]
MTASLSTPKSAAESPRFEAPIMVKNILGMVAGGYTMAGIIEAYPELTNNDVTARLSTPAR